MKKKRNWFLLGIYVLVVVINVLGWCDKSFGDKMRQGLFQVTQYMQGHISSIFSFSVGEILLGLALLLAAGAILFSCIWLIDTAVLMWRKKAASEKKDGGTAVSRKHLKYRRFVGRYLYVLVWITGIVSFIMSTNCFVLYHCSSFQDNYMPAEKREYKVRELALVRDYVVRQCNELAKEMERDEKGCIVYKKDMERQAMMDMGRLGETYPLLSGYYPTPKKFALSGFFSQQYIMGYYFPFSMEANYNDVMYIANVPVTVCHELSHAKGFIYEDDANFIGFLACTTSEDTFYRYSGYLSVLDYLNRDLYESLGNSREAYLTYEECSPLVERDNIFLTEEAWEEVESRAVIDTETVRQASRSFLETNLQVNGVEEGIASYGDVVEQLLVYYDGILY